MSVPKPWRGPKKPEKMKEGKEARESGGKFQRKVAEYLEMRNLWPMPGIDVCDGKMFGVSTKRLGEGFPDMVERFLEDAEISTRKKLPEGDAIQILGRAEVKEYLEDALCIMRLGTFKGILDRLRLTKAVNENGQG